MEEGIVDGLEEYEVEHEELELEGIDKLDGTGLDSPSLDVP